MRRQLVPALVILPVMTVLTGLVYPLVVTGVAQIAFGDQADGSLLWRGGRPVGSRLIGQSFTAARYFRPRPSAAGEAYDAMASGASNLGPMNPVLIAAAKERMAEYRRQNHLAAGQEVPVDAVTGSASGLDPQISPANARLQAPRVAAARGVALAVVLRILATYTDDRSLGFLGEPGVNVLQVNLALDERL